LTEIGKGLFLSQCAESRANFKALNFTTVIFFKFPSLSLANHFYVKVFSNNLFLKQKQIPPASEIVLLIKASHVEREKKNHFLAREKSVQRKINIQGKLQLIK
jgi:hypothetical protein